MTQEKPQTNKKPIGKIIIGIVIVLVVLAVIGNVIQNKKEQRNSGQKVSLSESQINSWFAQNIKKQAPSNNKVTNMKVSIHDGLAQLIMEWEKGQRLAADIVVSNETEFNITNVQVTGTGVLNEFFENLARDYFKMFLDGMVEAPGISIEKLEIVDSKLIIISNN